ncbi:MAG: hypothetical protein ACXVXF_07435 [Mycobacteriaceae bacterium]
MRYLPKPNTVDGSARFTPGQRPADNLLPQSMRDLFEERDRLASAAAASQALGEQLVAGLDAAAKVEDDNAAALAARAGKPIPPLAAAPKLQADCVEAVRVKEANEAAFRACVQDCSEHVSVVRHDTAAAAAKAQDKACANIEKLADQLSTAVERAVDAHAVQSWLNEGQYYRDARTWIADAVPDMSRHGLHHGNSVHYSAREIILGVATTVLEN